MKKIIISFIAISTLAFTTLSAQESTFNKGSKVINASIGLGSILHSGLGYSTKVPPVSASFELGIKDDFLTEKLTLGLGAYMGYSKYSWDYGIYNWGWNYSTIIIGARAAVHYPLIEKFDTYGGVMVGVNITTSTEFGSNSGTGYYTNTGGTGLAYSFYIGGRYYFTPNIAALGEIGYGISYLNLGLAFKF